MYEVTQKTLENAYKPFDVVTTKDGSVGFIQEVEVNKCQPNPKDQISYSIKWIVGKETVTAWWDHEALTLHCNLFVAIAECACHPMGNNASSVQALFNNMNR